jgi:hypothetical protein
MKECSSVVELGFGSAYIDYIDYRDLATAFKASSSIDPKSGR